VVVASARLGLRMLFAATLVFIALLLFAGRAHADTAAPATASTPAAAGTTPPPPSSTPPPAASTPPPTATAPPASGNPPAPAPNNSTAASPPPQTQSAPPPTGVQAQPTPSTPAGAPGPPQNNNNQGATVGTNGTSVANSGSNGATATTPKGTPAPTGTGSATGSTKTGGSTATGTDSNSTIGQQVNVHQSEHGTIDILQIALVVNVGVAHSNSGHNFVGAAGTGAPSIGMIKSTIRTGNAGAVGDSAKTGIKQSAVVGNGEQSNQSAMVVNVGIALGNSGLNITIGTLGSNGSTKSGQSVAVGTTSGQVVTGSSNAIGDKSKSRIQQLASGNASGTAVLTIDQRAIIVNFGAALANSGGNFALAAFDPSQLSPEEAAIVQAVLLALSPLFASNPAGSSAAGGTIAKVTTGNAQAVGNASTTDVSQTAVGHVSGDNQASSTQRAEVGNLGLALANTGFNGAIGGVSLNGLTQAHPELTAAQGALTQFLNLLTNLAWLNSANPFAQFAQSVDLGGVTLELGGSLTGTTFLAGWDSAFAPDGGPIPGGVRVRQISGVLNIGFATSDSGHNTVVALVTQSHEDTGKASKAGTKIVSGSPEVLAQVFTGSAMAVGNDSASLVCQTFHASVDCSWPQAPKPHPKPKPGHKPVPAPNPAPEPPVIVVSAAEQRPSGVAAAGAELPFTGGETQGLIALAGGLLAAGAALASRRRRGESRV
jgi:LPXTG-motif cell wall-anchored protein